MNLEDFVNTSFVVLQSDWDVHRGREMVERLRPSHVIVHRVEDPGDYYYLFPIERAKTVLSRAPNDVPLRYAFDLHEYQATTLLDAGTPLAVTSRPSVVHIGGRVLGFIEPASIAAAVEGPVARSAGGTQTSAPASPPGSAPPEGSVSRTLTAEFPQRVVKGAEEWLIVSLVAPTSGGLGLQVELPEGSQVDILVQSRRGFTLEGDPKGQLIVQASETFIRFKLRAGDDIGPAQLRVLAFFKGQTLGAIDLSPTIVPAAVAGAVQNQSVSQPLAPVAVRSPDLTMLIEERQSGGALEYSIRLTATDQNLGLNYKQFGPLRLLADPTKFFQDFYQDIEALPANADKAEIASKLARRGAYLFQSIFPKDLQEELWRVRDKIQSVIIQSDEPWIPWELFKLVGEEDGQVVEGPYLCEAYTVTRWVPGLKFKQPLSLKNIAVIVPQDSGLPQADAERNDVLALKGAGREVTTIPATTAAVSDALASGKYDCFHFTGHGAARAQNPDRSTINLEKDQTLMPEEISGVVTNLRAARPVVFLNACQVGVSAMSLTGIGGWARRFMDAGAGAFIGSYWSVYDTPARSFARGLYSRLVAGTAIGQAVKEARLDIKSATDSTWLAYTVFADPLATVQEPQS